MPSAGTDFAKIASYASKKRYALYAVCQLAVRSLALLLPYLTELLVDSVFDRNKPALVRCSAQMLAVVAVYVALLALTYYIKVCYEDASIAIQKKRIISRMTQLPLSALQEKGSGYYLHRFSTTVENCRSFLIDKPVNFCIHIFYAVGILISMLRIDVLYTALLLIIFPVLACVYHMLAKKVETVTTESEQISDRSNSFVEEVFACNYTIRANNAEAWMRDRTEPLLVAAFRKNREYNRIETVYDFFLITGLMNLMTSLVYILGAYYVFQDRVTFGMVTSMSLLVSKLWNPMEFYLDYPKERAKYLANKKRLEELFQEDAEPLPAPRKLEPFQELQMRDISLTVRDNVLFDGLRFRLSAGEHVAVYGSNGSGKSTLANLIAAIRQDHSGSITYNGIPYSAIHPQDIRDHICLIQAKAELFSGTVRENILLGRQAEIPPAVADMLRKKGLSLDMALQENGSNLSSGEGKLVQLARGFCRNCEVYIIDEPLNFIDENYAEMIISALDTLFESKTVVIISHDRRVLRSCTRYYHLANQVLTETDGLVDVGQGEENSL